MDTQQNSWASLQGLAVICCHVEMTTEGSESSYWNVLHPWDRLSLVEASICQWYLRVRLGRKEDPAPSECVHSLIQEIAAQYLPGGRPFAKTLAYKDEGHSKWLTKFVFGGAILGDWQGDTEI